MSHACRDDKGSCAAKLNGNCCPQDVPNAATKAEVTEYLGLGIFDTRPWRVQPTCAMSGAGMREGVDWLVTEIKRSQRALLLRQATYT